MEGGKHAASAYSAPPLLLQPLRAVFIVVPSLGRKERNETPRAHRPTPSPLGGKGEDGVKKIVVKIRNSQAFWILITGFHRMIHYLLVFFTVESYLVLPYP